MATTNPIEVQKHLEGLYYPASKESILQYARVREVDRESFALLEQLPDKEYYRPEEITEAIDKLQRIELFLPDLER